MSAVYFVQCPLSKLIKIGFATNVESRLRGLQTSSPSELTLLTVLKGDRAKERELHQRFAALRVRGEWFSNGLELLAYIRAVKYGRTADMLDDYLTPREVSDWFRDAGFRFSPKRISELVEKGELPGQRFDNGKGRIRYLIRADRLQQWFEANPTPAPMPEPTPIRPIVKRRTA